jgi:hypothetical protein
MQAQSRIQPRTGRMQPKPMNDNTVRLQNESKKHQTLMVVVVADKIGFRGMQDPSLPPNGLQHDTRANNPKDGVTAPKQNLDADLFRQF